ncbi:MAG: hypothetical protein JST63_03050 [Bacteroidetes bacterium]|jgi:hypothetical protein|uniref:hypothetical protein n=1 Tax=uncultured Dysgonomonas sp. TaxID=206096 RepID=UPI001ACE3D8C|nr:hypothetical protein [uncultured Dysgonomonas sp.]MBN9484553.1 hypothetical protein [Bacteroidota bacterium]MBS1748862.1 hypothetical protein [Bacteroidota bacterium]
MIIRNLLLAGVLLCCSCNGICQTKKAHASCTDACCKDGKKDKKTVENNVITIAMNDSAKKKPITCKLTTPELQERKTEVLASLKAKVMKREELPKGYSYLFASTDKNIDEVTAFIKTERTCCDFFSFKIAIEDKDLWLTITGEDGTKGFITGEMGL